MCLCVKKLKLNNMTKCLIIEDELAALDFLKNDCLASMPDTFTVVAEFDNGREAYRYLDKNHADIDIVFLDIGLLGTMSGIDILALMEGKIKIPVILTTAAENTILAEAGRFEVNSYYLVKPFSVETFKRKVTQVLKLESTPNEINTQTPAVAKSYIYVDVVRKGDRIAIKVELAAIRYIEWKNITRQAVMYLDNGDEIMVSKSLEFMANNVIPEGKSCRIQDKYLLGNCRFVEEFRWTDREIVLSDGKKLPIGDAYLKNLKEYKKNHA
jgi:DNA-binding LytR/AlgR family response regulator